ncbi:hemolysin family protein [Rubrobacter aplysinae]|uniref:hemolysin family protein n=1 Tax=Rubrobacter aplysinae TaxID=909625 RepID=UPI000A4153B0|nr:hemolysin family protein [Rubrobacter aplysinae]
MKILASLLLVALNGLFVAAEFAFVRIRATQVDRMVREGRTSSNLVQTATSRLDQYLAVCQLGITISSLGIGALAEPAIAHLIEPIFESVGVPGALVHPAAIAIALLIASFFHVVFGELAPKTLAIQKAEGTSLFVAPFMRFFYYLLYPFTKVFNGTANAVTRAFGVPPAGEGEESHTEEEIRTLISQSTRQGFLEADESEMIGGVFELGDTTVREIMVPRPDVVSFSADTPLSELVTGAAAGNYTRYPIYEGETGDGIIGAVHVKDLLRSTAESVGDTNLEATPVEREIVREVLTVPENRRIDDILDDFQKREIQMAVVIDEWGSFEGIVTIEDILEEIVGEIRDEFDEEEPLLRKLSSGAYSVDGRIPIGVVNEALEASFESEDFDTIGGLVLGQLGRAPEEGDEVLVDGHLMRVDEVDGSRVSQLLVQEAEEEHGDHGKEPEPGVRRSQEPSEGHEGKNDSHDEKD